MPAQTAGNPPDPKTPTLSDRDRSDLIGETIGDFHLLRSLGQGGMGQVYLAEQISLKRRVALKLLRRDQAGNEISRKRFEAEAKAVARLSHPNIVQVYAVGEEAGLQYMALEFIDGRNLRDYVARKGPPNLPVSLSIMRQVAAALQRASELGIIHRDIKPENVLLTRKGEVKIADFGLSRIMGDGPALNLTQSGTTLGTPLYMSPEQVEGKALDIRTDIYSFGVTCYHMLAGHPPFQGETAYAVAIQHVSGEALSLVHVRPDLPAELCAMVAKMMAKRPEDRYQTPRDILNELRRVPQNLDVQRSRIDMATPPVGSAERTGPLSGPYQLRRLLRKSLVWKVAGSLAVALAVGSLAGWLFTSPPSAVVAEGQLTSTLDEEAALRVLVQGTENPGKDPDKLRRGVEHRIELGLLLLRDRELDPESLPKAAAFFREQSQSSVEGYALIGRLGEAMTLAFQDRPAESNQQFLRALSDVQRRGPVAVRSPELLKVISKALDHNYQNSPTDFPRDLERWRQAPRFLPDAPGLGRPRVR